MAKTRMSSKGQVVIPKEIREAMHWDAGTDLEVLPTDDGVLLRPAGAFPRTTVEQVVGCTGYEGPRISLAEMERAIDAEARRRR